MYALDIFMLLIINEKIVQILPSNFKVKTLKSIEDSLKP